MSDWYARRLAAGRQSPPPVQYQQAPPQPPPVQQAPTQAHYQRPTPSSLQTDHCPSCASGNYMAAPGSKYQRCYDCGYPVVQSGTGVGSVGSGSTDGTVHKATQVPTGGYHPTQIVGRVE